MDSDDLGPEQPSPDRRCPQRAGDHGVATPVARHVVFVSGGRHSLLNAEREATRRLRTAGHRVTIVTTEAGAKILGDGEDAVVLQAEAEQRRASAADPRPKLSRPNAFVRWLARGRHRRHHHPDALDELESVVGGLTPDLVIIDVELHSAILATEHLGVPRALATNFFSIHRRPGLPPLHTGVAPPTTAVGRALVDVVWGWVRVESVLARVRHRLSPAGLVAPFQPPPFDTVDPLDIALLAERVGVDLSQVADRGHWLRPHAYRHLPIVCFQEPDLDLPHDPAPDFHYAGSMIDARRPERPLPPIVAERWKSLTDRRGRGSERPLVYCSLGTFWAPQRHLIDEIIATFARRSDWDLIIGLGGTLDADHIGPLPANVLAVQWAPQLSALAAADCAIIHGGSASLCEALWFGVPTVVWSTGQVDQHGNARRIAHHGLGIWAGGRRRWKRPRSAEIEAAVVRALDDDAIRATVDRWRERLRAEADGDRLVAVVEELVAAGATAPLSGSGRSGRGDPPS